MPMWIVVAVILASSDLRLRAVEGVSWTEMVGSSGGWEEVEGSCSWVAMMFRRVALTIWRSGGSMLCLEEVWEEGRLA